MKLPIIIFISSCLTLSTLLVPVSLHAAELEASDGASRDALGGSWDGYPGYHAAAISGGLGLLGANHNDDGGTARGSAYVFRNFTTATGVVFESAKLLHSDGNADDAFGDAVSLDGSTALIGAFSSDISGNRSGRAYLYRNLDTATGTSVAEDAILTSPDVSANDRFADSVSISGSVGLIGSYGDDFGGLDRGSAYLYRNLDTVTGTVNQDVTLRASDAANSDYFGGSVAIDGNLGIVGAHGDDDTGSASGSVYVFQNLNAATNGSTINESAKLIASDGVANLELGWSSALSGNKAIIGAGRSNIGGSDSGRAYLYRNLDTVTGTANTENAILTGSTTSALDQFGITVAISGNVGLIGAHFDDIGGTDRGSAYLYLGLDSATGTITENILFTASDGKNGDRFGSSTAIDGDNFIVGATYADGVAVDSGKGYSGSVESFTTTDSGGSHVIDGISFVTQDDWNIGENNDNNSVTLSTGDSGNVTVSGKTVAIGRNAGSDNNTLTLDGTLTATQVNVGASGNSGNAFHVEGGLTGDAQVFANSMIGGDGTITGDLDILNGGKFIFDITKTLSVTGAVAMTSTFGIDDLIGMNSSVAEGIYDIIDTTMTDFSSLGIQNWGESNARYLGENKIAYFQNGLQVVVTEGIPEPSSALLLLIGATAFLKRRIKK
ncbi:MAG: PEP-CTERM sorting domain-containing protein [Chthoniobacterales bacterium]